MLGRAVDRVLGRVGERQRGDGGAHRLHRRCVHRVAVDDRRHRRRQRAGFGELLLERLELVGRRQLALEQQVCDLFVARVLGKLGDVVAAVHEHARIRIDRADARLGDRDAGERDGLLRP